jgi:hypothetical protein
MLGRNSILFLLLGTLATNGFHFLHPPSTKHHNMCSPLSATKIDFQADDWFGRGLQHISASLVEGDTVVYQTGTWMVDGVFVGDGPMEWHYCTIQTIQLVWTHNCEHGVLRGLAVDRMTDTTWRLTDPWVDVEFGPDQLIAKLPVVWDGDRGVSLVPIDDTTWIPLAAPE